MTERTSTLRRTGLQLIALLAMSLAACNDDDTGGGGDGGGGGSSDPDGGAEPQPPDDQALLRFVHAAPDAHDLDIYIEGDDEPLLEGVSFREASPHVALEPGSHPLALRLADSSPESDPLLVTGPIELVEGRRVSAAAAGFANEQEEPALRVIAVEEEFGDPGVGRAMIRFIHVSPDLERIAVDLAPGEGREIEEIERFGDTGAGGIPVPAGTKLRVEVLALAAWTWRAGIFTLPPLSEGAEVLIFAVGRQTDDGPGAPDALSLVVLDAGGASEIIRHDPVLHAIHGIPDAPAVNVALGAEGQIWNLGFGALSRGVAVPPGVHEVTFRPTAGGDVLGVGTTAELQRAGRYLVVGAGYATPEEDEPNLRVITAADDFELDAAEDVAQAKVVHAVADAPAIDVSTIEDRQLAAPPPVTDLAFGEVSEPFALPIGTLDAGAAPTGIIWPMFRFPLPTAEAPRLFAVPVGALQPKWDERFLRTVIVDVSGGVWSELSD